MPVLQRHNAARTPDRVGLEAFTVVAVHAGLGAALASAPVLGTIHALTTVGVALWVASSRRRPHLVAYCVAYITGAEVFWRMSGASIFWEAGKYATIATLGMSLVRVRPPRTPAAPLLYFLLLLPSTALTVGGQSAMEARNQISFNLSGPAALFMASWFFGGLRLTTVQLQRVLLAVIGPVVTIAVVALMGILTNPDITWSDGSNFATSGGFGPNQVSAALGFGALCALLLLVVHPSSWTVRALLFALILGLGTQSALTFSRGGLYNAAAGAVVALLCLMTDTRARVRIIIVAALLFVIGHYVILPRLETFTEGTLSKRFEDVGWTGRDRLLEDDLRIWGDNPILGVGPGQAKLQRRMRLVAAHTEFSRALSEHGLFGLVSLLILFVSGIRNVHRMPTPAARAVAAALIAWGAIFMLNSAMRVVAPSFVFGLSAAALMPDQRRVASSVRAALGRRADSAAIWPAAPRMERAHV